jgi:hypothetical protein
MAMQNKNNYKENTLLLWLNAWLDQWLDSWFDLRFKAWTKL